MVECASERIPSKSGQNNLEAQIRRVNNINHPNDWIILCHGLGAHKNIRLFQNIIKETPINSIAFDFHCCGKSTGQPEDWGLGDYDVDAYDDLEGIKAWVRESQKGNVKIILGHSRGANVVLMNAARYDDVDYVISLSARFDMSTGLDPYFYPGDRDRLQEGLVHTVRCAKKFSDGVPRFICSKDLEKRLSINPSEIKEKIKNCAKIFIVHGTADTVIPQDHARLIYEHCPPSKGELRFIEGADHELREHQDELSSQTIDVYNGIRRTIREIYASIFEAEEPAT